MSTHPHYPAAVQAWADLFGTDTVLDAADTEFAKHFFEAGLAAGQAAAPAPDRLAMATTLTAGFLSGYVRSNLLTITPDMQDQIAESMLSMADRLIDAGAK